MNIIILFFLSFVALAQTPAKQAGDLIQSKDFNSSSNNLGDIKITILSEGQFQAINGDCWVEMKGQSITGSDLAAIGISSLPDARGTFFRAANNGRSDGNENPENKLLGEYQADAMQPISGTFGFTDDNSTSYRHRVIDISGAFTSSSTTTSLLSGSGGSASGAGSRINFDSSIQTRTSVETRPKNVTMNQFIKINKECNF